MNQSKTPTRLLGLIGAALLALVLLAPAAQAKEPAMGYGALAGCPSPEENSETTVCIRADVTGGHLQMGSKDVPIKNTITLSGGVNEELENFDESPKGGLSKAKQEIPGGIIGLTGLDWLINFLGAEALKVYAVAELAGPPTGITFSTVTLPLKVNLVNPVLGKNCYVGSTSKPIVLNLTTGTTEPPPPNEPITGDEGDFSVDGKGIVHIDNGTFVDNAFAAPAASGCVLTLLGFIPISLDGVVNLQAGLPAAAGTNEAVQEFDQQLAAQSAVYQ